ncbi:hypothetical protein SERAS_00700 [Serratia marcescens]|nr:hypothetical protein SERAS_00700 [Serratia marcescens]
MGQRRYLTQSEVERLLQQAREGENAERDYCLIYMSFIHGFRVSEACGVRLSDLDLRGAEPPRFFGRVLSPEAQAARSLFALEA